MYVPVMPSQLNLRGLLSTLSSVLSSVSVVVMLTIKYVA